MRRSPLRLLVQGAVIAALVGGTTALVHFDKALTVTVDGEPMKVHTFAKTVGGVLDEERIEVGPHDTVAPALDTTVSDGTRIAVRYGRRVTINVDGRERTAWVTAISVHEALSQLGIRDGGTFVSVSRSKPIGRDGLAFDVRLPRSVKLTVEGASRTIETTAQTAAEAVIAAGVPLTERDLVLPDRGAHPEEGAHIQVFKISGKAETRTESIAFETRRVSDSSIYEGESKVTQAGKNGSRSVIYELVLTDGEWAIKRELAVTAVTKPVERVINVGTKARPASGGTPSASSDDLNWAALARCESGGNPSAVSPNGLYYGLYQFALATWRSVGGTGNPIDASPAEQTKRAQILYDRSGDSPWPVCGSRLYS